VLGVFNRITFPAFLLIPGLQLLPHFFRKYAAVPEYLPVLVVADVVYTRPLSILSIIGFGSLFTLIAILMDTAFYRPSTSILSALRAPVVTPLNNLRYNSDTANLATHGLHPRYQHFLANLPQLLGPAYVLIILSLFTRSTMPVCLKNRRAISAISATTILSIFPHQEARFLIPCVPLLLSCIRPRKSRLFLTTWIAFNAALGFLMGMYHQGGVVPTQLEIPSIVAANVPKPPTELLPGGAEVSNSATVFWWKTYSPPHWLLGDNSSLPLYIQTRDLMGIPGPEMIQELEKALPECPSDRTPGADQGQKAVFLVAPRSATFLDPYTQASSSSSPAAPAAPSDGQLQLHEVWTYEKHLNLDDLNFGDDGIFPTLRRVIGRRGLTVWAVKRAGCEQ